jgi:hypothetical protein
MQTVLAPRQVRKVDDDSPSPATALGCDSGSLVFRLSCGASAAAIAITGPVPLKLRCGWGSRGGHSLQQGTPGGQLQRFPAAGMGQHAQHDS